MFLAKLNEVLASKKSFIQDPLNAGSLSVAALLNIIHWLILLIKIRPGSALILLHYNVVSGADLIAKSWHIYWIPMLALGLLVVNIILAIRFYKKEKVAAYFINLSSIVVQVIFLIASIVLIFANAQ